MHRLWHFRGKIGAWLPVHPGRHCLDKNRDFLKKGGVFTDDMIFAAALPLETSAPSRSRSSALSLTTYLLLPRFRPLSV